MPVAKPSLVGMTSAQIAAGVVAKQIKAADATAFVAARATAKLDREIAKAKAA